MHAKTIGHPSSEMAQTRTAAILDYGDEVRSAMSVNHNHSFGRRHQVGGVPLRGIGRGGARQDGRPASTIRAASRTSSQSKRRAMRTGSMPRCMADGSPTRSSDAWQICSDSSPARTRCSSPRSRTPGRRWRWSRRRSSRAPGRRRRSGRIREMVGERRRRGQFWSRTSLFNQLGAEMPKSVPSFTYYTLLFSLNRVELKAAVPRDPYGLWASITSSNRAAIWSGASVIST